MLSTIQFKWDTYFNVISHELDKLEKMAESDAKQKYATKIKDNISKMWAALYKEINDAEYQDKRDRQSIQTLDACLQECDSQTNRDILEESRKFLTVNAKNIEDLNATKTKLIGFAKRLESLTKTPFSANQNFRNATIATLEGQLLFKRLKQINKMQKTDFIRNLSQLLKDLEEKRKIWAIQLEAIKTGVYTKLLSFEAAKLSNNLEYVKAYKEDLFMLNAKLKETDEMLKVIADVAKVVVSANTIRLK